MSKSKYQGGFESRQEVKTAPANPVDFTMSWATRDSNWRLRAMPQSPFKDKLKATSGTVTAFQGVILDAGFYQAGGKNFPTTAFIHSNLCRPGMMDVLIVEQRHLRGGDRKVVATGPWGDIKEDLSNPKVYGARWENVVIALVTQVTVAAWNKETERNEKARTIKGRFIVKLELAGFSFRDGFEKSVRENNIALDAKQVYNRPFKYDGKAYTLPQPKNQPDHHYPSFEFLSYEDMTEKVADPLFEAAKDAFSRFWDGYFVPHVEHVEAKLRGDETFEHGDDMPEEDEEKIPDDLPEAFKTAAERKATKTEKKIEEKKKLKKGEKQFEKVEVEDDPEAALEKALAQLKAAGVEPGDELLAALKKKAAKTADDLPENDDEIGEEEFDNLGF